MKNRIYLLSLGCPKNLVDSEAMAGSLIKAGFSLTTTPSQADLILVNTCGFIDDAKAESIEAILQLSKLRKKLVVTGCLAQIGGREIFQGIPEVSAVVGLGEERKIAQICLQVLRNGHRILRLGLPHPNRVEHSPSKPLTPFYTSYLKIADGCDNRCSYCLIPRIRGRLRSIPIEILIRRARLMAQRGVKELILVAQDLSSYGLDLYGKPMLAELLSQLDQLEGISWIRLLYLHPVHLSPELIEAVAGGEKICKYLDLPLQHISDRILKEMNRRTKGQDLRDLIPLLRASIPGVVLRTAFIVGLPGETEDEFEELLEFVWMGQFEKLGCFIYSPQKGTLAARLPGQIPFEVKRERQERLLTLQAEVSRVANQKRLGRKEIALIEGKNSPSTFLGRTQGEAPEIDGQVIIRGENLKPGDMVGIKITGASDFDLHGQVDEDFHPSVQHQRRWDNGY